MGVSEKWHILFELPYRQSYNNSKTFKTKEKQSKIGFFVESRK